MIEKPDFQIFIKPEVQVFPPSNMGEKLRIAFRILDVRPSIGCRLDEELYNCPNGLNDEIITEFFNDFLGKLKEAGVY